MLQVKGLSLVLILLDHFNNNLRVDLNLFVALKYVYFRFNRLDMLLVVMLEALAVPRVISDLLDSVPLAGICVQYFRDKLAALFRDVPRYGILTVHYLLVKLVGIRVLKGQISAKHGV